MKVLTRYLVVVGGIICQTIIPPAFAQGRDPIVLLQTTKGDIAIRVFQHEVPNTAGNFLDLVSRGFYNGLSFHRIETWCIQGGDPNGNGSGDFVDPQTGRVRRVPLEISPRLGHNAPGVVAMARSQDRNSASCQFYITKAPVKQLDGNYAVFGGVVDGMNAVRNMQRGDRIISAQIVEGGGNQQQPRMQSRPSIPSGNQPAGKPGDSGF